MMNNSTSVFITTGSSAYFISYLPKNLTSVENCMFGLNVMFGFPTQFYVIWLIVSGSGGGISSEFFFLNLTVCEIFNCLDCFVFLLSKWFLVSLALSLLLQGLCISGRPLFQCLICVERYLAVVHPVIFLKYKPLRYRAICSAAAWLFCLGCSLFCLFALISSNVTAHAWYFSILILVLLSIQLFCLTAVLRVLKRSGPGERGREINHMKKRAFYLILITTVSMIVIYVPMSVSGFFIIVSQKFISELWIPALLSYVLGGFLQPVLYLHRCGKLFCFSSS